jgi:hypothetical protein
MASDTSAFINQERKASTADLSELAPNFDLTTRYRELSFVQRTTYSY